ncbi:MAG: hypothetical protein ACI4D8_03980 [Wujia sp.]
MIKKLKKLSCYAMVAVMLLNVNVPAVRAAEKEFVETSNASDVSDVYDEVICTDGQEIITGVVEDWDSEEVLSSYLDSEFSGKETLPSYYSSAYNGSKLTGVNLAVYNSAKAQIEKIASGEETSTKIYVSASELGYEDVYWSAADLGVAAIYDTTSDEICSDAVDALRTQLDYDYSKVIYSLLRDCPYEMYWFGNTYSVNNIPLTASYKDGEYKLSIGDSVYLGLEVSTDYKGADEFTVDAEKITAVNNAITNAKQIVTDAKYKSDYNKLNYYMEQLCDLNSYNSDAASDDYTGGYGDPWQVIYMFDGDSTTNVVCEGYSKSFQYLCDMTSFNSPDIYCYTVTGNMSYTGGGGGHMWNIIHMDDGKQYMVDVTNCDGSTIDKSLFIGIPDRGDTDNGYIFNRSGSNTLTYVYDDTTKLIYRDAELTLSSVAYSVPADEPTDGETLEVNATNFPDAVFRDYISDNFDLDGNRFINPDEVMSIMVNSYEISSLEGIEYFTELTYLYCYNASIDKLDVSHNLELINLVCSNTNVKEINLDNNSKLKWLECNNNQLVCLNVKATKDLEPQISMDQELIYPTCDNNSRTVLLSDDRTIDLSTFSGFDVTKMSNINGGVLDDTILTFTSNEVSYTYDCGNGLSGEFKLVADSYHVHSYEQIETIEPTCENDGKIVYTCECGDSYDEILPATGHKPIELAAVAATCTGTGLTAGSKCSVCNKVLVAQTTVAAKGHTYKENTSKRINPTYFATGTATYVCSGCGASYTSTLPKLRYGTSTGVYKINNTWYYVSNGYVDLNYNGIGSNSYGDWFIKNGVVDFNQNGVIKITNGPKQGWYYFQGGKVQYVDTVAKNEYGWWYIKNGKVDFTANTVAKNEYGWWYIKNGKVDFTANTVAKNEYGWWYIRNGKVDFTANTVAKNEYGWWYIKNGKVDFSFNGIGYNSYGGWKIVNGKVDFSYNGNYRWNGRTYRLIGGKVQ